MDYREQIILDKEFGPVRIQDTKDLTIAKSRNYNYVFNKADGKFFRWGKEHNIDPDYAPFPEILDCEVTTICDNGCPWCYKSNTTSGKNMSFETFKKVLDSFPRLTQVAFGADAKCKANPDIWRMMDYCRQKDVVPNITVADIDDRTAALLASLCGAVAVSRYSDKNKCYNSVEKLIKAGLKQVNIHQLVAVETLTDIYETMSDYKSDSRLKELNAIVFLSLKKKGRGSNMNTIKPHVFKSIIDHAMELNIPIGFDSCSAHKFLAAIKDRSDYKKLEMMCEPCESSCFSFYVNVDGEAFPCSFTEGTPGWEKGIPINYSPESFITQVWKSPRLLEFRKTLLEKGRSCPIFDI